MSDEESRCRKRKALARDGEIDPSVAITAAKEYRIDDVQAAEVSYADTGSAYGSVALYP